MEKNVKITKAMKNSTLIALLKGETPEYDIPVEELVAHLEHENELLAKKNNGAERKPTKLQKENIAIKDIICNMLGIANSPTTIAELQSLNGELENLSNQKISALLRQLITEGRVVRTEIKGKAYFSLLDNESEE